MFTGIVECMGEIKAIQTEQNNIHFTIESSIGSELKIDQSVAHNGVCLTVVETMDNTHVVTAIHETLNKTDLKSWAIGKHVNLERCMKADGRFDGHIVQGHVDCTATCVQKLDEVGSWRFTFKYPDGMGTTVEKGSITVNGTSLTVVGSMDNEFSVAIIPYTYEHTVFGFLNLGDTVNLEFDIVGKYIQKIMAKSI
jgi:riboflavin synthase